MTPPVRITMWSGPRNISTAMMRAFGNRPDTAVIDEPFYAAYLAETGIDHPLRAAVLASQPKDWRQVVLDITGKVPGGLPVYYQKHMTHHMLPKFGRDWIAATRPAFLIRDPAQVVASYRLRREEVTLADIGIRQQAELFDQACDKLGHAPPVIDAADILADPESALTALCEALELPFDKSMLRWAAGPRPTDGVWAPAWYQSVYGSTGFEAPARASAARHPISDAAAPCYNRLAAHRLRPKARASAPYS